MKYIFRIITLPFVWLYTIVTMTILYLQYGMAVFTDTENVCKAEKLESKIGQN